MYSIPKMNIRLGQIGCSKAGSMIPCHTYFYIAMPYRKYLIK